MLKHKNRIKSDKYENPYLIISSKQGKHGVLHGVSLTNPSRLARP
jgi:hypothetical protein